MVINNLMVMFAQPKIRFVRENVAHTSNALGFRTMMIGDSGVDASTWTSRSKPMLALAFALSTAPACRQQSFDEAMRIACELPDEPAVRAKIDAVSPDQPADRVSVLMREAKDRIRNAEARELLFTTTPKGDERERIREAVKRAGIARCWMTEPSPAKPAAHPAAAASSVVAGESSPDVSVVEPSGALREGCRVDRLAEWCGSTPWNEHDALGRWVGGASVLFARARAAHVKTCEQRSEQGNKTATLTFDADGQIIRSETVEGGKALETTARYVAGRLVHFEKSTGMGTRIVDLESAGDEDCLRTTQWKGGSRDRHRCWGREGAVISIVDGVPAVSKRTATSLETRAVKGYREEWDAQGRTTLISSNGGELRVAYEYGERETRVRRDGALAWTWTLDERGLPSSFRDERRGVTEKITCK